MSLDLSLSTEILSDIQDCLDSLIAPPYTKTCRLYYPGAYIDCENCEFSQIGQKSSNYYTTGGPIPFPNGTICPMCNGSGRKSKEVFEDIQLLCAFMPKDFFHPINGLEINAPYGIVQTKGFSTNLPKVQQCEHMIFQVDIAQIARRKYKLLSEPGDNCNIIDGRYFVANWERRG